jgi:hypothetical protein
MAADLETQRYEDLTAAETPSMFDGILQLLNGDEDRARRVINLSLDLEHLISVLPLDPKQARQELLDEVRTFRDQLVALTGKSIPLHLFGERITDQVRPETSGATSATPTTK